MSAMIEAPVDLLEAMAELHLPRRADQRLQELMDQNTEGALTATEREELEGLVEWSEVIAPIRAKALHVLARKPI